MIRCAIRQTVRHNIWIHPVQNASNKTFALPQANQQSTVSCASIKRPLSHSPNTMHMRLSLYHYFFKQPSSCCWIKISPFWIWLFVWPYLFLFWCSVLIGYREARAFSLEMMCVFRWNLCFIALQCVSSSSSRGREVLRRSLEHAPHPQLILLYGCSPCARTHNVRHYTTRPGAKIQDERLTSRLFVYINVFYESRHCARLIDSGSQKLQGER